MASIKQHLTHLESTGLIHLAQTHPELEYLFRHALVQDAAYESLLLTDRKELHRQVAETLERLYPDRLVELSPMLAMHFAQANDSSRALKYFILAGDNAFATNANAEAIAHYSQAIEIAANQTNFPANELIHLYTRRGRALELNSLFDEAEANYQELENLAAQYDNKALELAGLMARATIYAIPSSTFNPDRGEVLCRQTLALAQHLADRAAEAKILWNLMLLHFFRGHTDEGLKHGEQSLELARAFNLKEQQAYTLNDLAGYCYLPAGNYGQGQAALKEARAIWQELGNESMLADNLATSAFNLFLYGDFEQSHALSSQAYRINQTIANLWGQSYSRAITGLVNAEQGKSNQAIAVLEEAAVLADQAGFVAGHVIAGGVLAIQYAVLGDFDRGLTLAQKIVAVAERQIGFWKPHALGSLALVYLHRGNLTAASETLTGLEAVTLDPNRFAMSFVMALLADCELGLAQQEYQRVITLLDHQVADLRRRQINAYLPYLLYYRGQAWLGQKQPGQALEAFHQARTLAEKLGSKHIWWPILMSLKQLESDPAQANALHQQAREIVEDIANHAPPEIREAFLNLPQVREVLDG